MRFNFVITSQFFSVQTQSKYKMAAIAAGSVGFLLFLASCSSTKQRTAKNLEKNLPKTQASYLEKKAKPVMKVEAKEPEQAAPSTSPSRPITAHDTQLNLKKIATGLGVPSTHVGDQARILANFLERGQVPRNICDDDDNEIHEHLCSMIDVIRDTKKQYSKSSTGQRRVPIRPHHFRYQQSMGYGRLVNSITRESAERVLAWSPKLLEQTSCPRNLSAAAVRKLESLLPNPRAKMMMEKLYLHASACLQPDNEGYEITHFRQALLRKLWNNTTGARFSINRAALARESTEKSRVLYWAGSLQSSPQKRRVYWEELVKEYPLSYHALEVWKEEKQDPLHLFASRPDIQLNAKTQNPDERLSQAMNWVEALYYTKNVEAAAKLSRWLTTNFKDQLTPPNKFYLSLLKTQRGETDTSIHYLTRQVANNPDILNEQTLKLLFPRPFYEIFSRASPRTDTNLVLAVARQESGFNPRARSRANAQGLLQLLPTTAQMLTRERRPDLYDKETNAELGVKFLSNLIEKFGSVEHALMGYNAGPGRVGEWKRRFQTDNSILFMDLVPFNETRNYVSAILRNNYWYTRLYSKPKNSEPDQSPSGAEQRSHLVSQLIKNHVAVVPAASTLNPSTQTF